LGTYGRCQCQQDGHDRSRFEAHLTIYHRNLYPQALDGAVLSLVLPTLLSVKLYSAPRVRSMVKIRENRELLFWLSPTRCPPILREHVI
jgi:hypothetical protein